MSDLQALLDTIDEVAVDVCGHCDTPLNPDGPSPYYCDDVCQERWLALQGDRLEGYQEPRLNHADVWPVDMDATYWNFLNNAPRRGGEIVYFIRPDFSGWDLSMAEAAASFARLSAAMRGFRIREVWLDEILISDASHAAAVEVEDAQARALRLRRERNTGPAPHSRAPRRIDARRNR